MNAPWTYYWPALAIAGLLVAQPAQAQDGELLVRWKNTLHYSTALRLEQPLPKILADPNTDDGDRNFRRGLVSNRADLLSELNISMGDVGAEVSGAAWYDTRYHRRTGNTNTATLNTLNIGTEKFAKSTRRLHGSDAELLTAYVYGSFNNDDMPVSLRVGRSHLQWGESLFFADNGIAAGQTPIDTIKGISVPSSTAKEVFMPVAQVWASVQPTPDLAIEAYYQLEWRKSRLPSTGSYFNTADYLDGGGESLFVGPGQFFRRGVDQVASASGQFGVALHLHRDEADYGAYALRYNAKEPQIYLRLGPFLGVRSSAASLETPSRERSALYGSGPSIFISGPSTGTTARFNYGLYGNPLTGEVGNYQLTYPEDIEVYGLSFSGYLSETTIAGELSARRHTPLVSAPLLVFQGQAADNDTTPRYAIGDTLHAQISTIIVLPQSKLWQGATFSTEIAANRRMGISANKAAIDTARDRTAVSLRAQFEPQFFAVLPGLDLSVPAGFGLGIAGRSSVNQGQIARAGDIEIGMRGTYRSVWEASVRVTHFIGGTRRQPFADRDFISLSLKRTL